MLRFDKFAGMDTGGLSGQYTFSNLSTTNLSDARQNNLGNGWASFMLGEVYAWFFEGVMPLNAS